ncbi:MAG: hypothetical protein ABL888_04215 [Pirellulaceae bacterium]
MKKPDRLYELLPMVYRQRDAEQGYPLRALLRVIAEQVEIVEGDIDQLYRNWFIETCEDWVVPYIGDLIGFRPVHDAGEPGDPRIPSARQLNKILIPRREVANTIGYRRRKGTLALLELLANNVAGWPARAVEFYQLLGWTQHLNHLHPQRGRMVDLRNGDMLARIGGPFDELAHTVDVRRVVSTRTRGCYNIPSTGLFVWRLQPYSVGWTNAEANDWKSAEGCTTAYCQEDIGSHCYTFSVLGNDQPLYNRPQRETDPTHIAGELNLPTPILHEAFENHVFEPGQRARTQASEDYYGLGKSLTIWAADWPIKGAEQPIPASAIIPADLSQWHYRAPRDHIVVDPTLGRFVFPSRQPPKHGVIVHYHYAFSADLGGGEYERPLSQPENAQLYRVGKDHHRTIALAIKQWSEEKQKPLSAVIEITDSGVYTESLSIDLKENESLQIRAAKRTRPVIRLLDYIADRPDAFCIRGAKGSRVTLDGLLIYGRGILVDGPDSESDGKPLKVQGDLCDLTIRHCTLVPGWGLHCDCEPRQAGEPSLELRNTGAQVKIEHSILGAIEVVAGRENNSVPGRIDISDSIWDATNDERDVLSGPDGEVAYIRLAVARSTVLGQILTHEIELAENCIFRGNIMVARRQTGCVRFCYVQPGSRTPRRYECQPDLVHQAIKDDPEMPDQSKPAALLQAADRVRPQFNSVRYGKPNYCQLAETCAAEIKRGADDESEMGAFHDLYQPQRAANLSARLTDFIPAGMDAGINFST